MGIFTENIKMGNKKKNKLLCNEANSETLRIDAHEHINKLTDNILISYQQIIQEYNDDILNISNDMYKDQSNLGTIHSNLIINKINSTDKNGRSIIIYVNDTLHNNKKVLRLLWVETKCKDNDEISYEWFIHSEHGVTIDKNNIDKWDNILINLINRHIINISIIGDLKKEE